MRVLIFMLAILVFSSNGHAVDATKLISLNEKIDDWQMVEFALPKDLLYRVASYSINEPNSNLAFDFVAPTCQPDGLILVRKFDSYKKSLDNGKLLMAYKIPGQEENFELVSTEMVKGDKYAFFKFSQLGANALLSQNSSGRLAIWIPQSGDGRVERGENIYFSLKGFLAAYNLAKSACEANLNNNYKDRLNLYSGNWSENCSDINSIRSVGVENSNELTADLYYQNKKYGSRKIIRTNKLPDDISTGWHKFQLIVDAKHLDNSVNSLFVVVVILSPAGNQIRTVDSLDLNSYRRNVIQGEIIKYDSEGNASYANKSTVLMNKCN